ncbi:uncharacterized protein LOC133717778 [Rosa rugosa]|uniref:uncharacterized protein LOC133717778 n=1 Tax=Rosa rugosa TaxID=74645 RepID=UPI002B40D230|nr:uncharacterized protein LOC133717778 [Rosa rugosa]
MVSEDIIFEGDMDNSQNALAENHIMSGAEDAAETSDASTNNTGSADSEGSLDEAQSENFEHEGDGRIDHSLPPPESSMVEIDMDDLGENQLPNIDQQLANSANLAKDVEDIGVLGREALLNHQIHVQVKYFNPAWCLSPSYSRNNLNLYCLCRYENLEAVQPWSWLFSTQLNKLPLCSECLPLLLLKGYLEMIKLSFEPHRRLSLWNKQQVILVWSYFSFSIR